MPEKKCKYCAMMIPEDAEICPHCRKRIKTSFITKSILVIIIIFGSAYYCSVPSFQSYKDKAQAVNTKIESKTKLTVKGQKVKKAHQSWSNDDCNTIGEKKIHIGMDKEQVRAAWGKPYKINETSGSWGVHEQWVMHDSMNSSYVYFENGIMTSLQQSK